jgi:hypothetical protein
MGVSGGSREGAVYKPYVTVYCRLERSVEEPQHTRDVSATAHMVEVVHAIVGLLGSATVKAALAYELATKET